MWKTFCVIHALGYNLDVPGSCSLLEPDPSPSLIYTRKENARESEAENCKNCIYHCSPSTLTVPLFDLRVYVSKLSRAARKIVFLQKEVAYYMNDNHVAVSCLVTVT